MNNNGIPDVMEGPMDDMKPEEPMMPEEPMTDEEPAEVLTEKTTIVEIKNEDGSRTKTTTVTTTN